jgi:hypothetical protein
VRGWPARVPFPAGQDLSLLHRVQTDSRAHPTLYQRVLEAASPGSKTTGREADHSPSSIAKVKNGGAIPPLPHISSWLST